MISFVICASNHSGNDLATPFVESILKYEPDSEIVLVDNGSTIPYRESENYKLLRLDYPLGSFSYPRALNEGFKLTIGDWIAFCNDDVLCTGKFKDLINGLNRNILYANEKRYKNPSWGAGVRIDYLFGWILLMHRSLYLDVGQFDEFYNQASCDDLDYCWRAYKKGFSVDVAGLPFEHLDLHRRTQVKDFDEINQRNKAYFIEKVKGQK